MSQTRSRVNPARHEAPAVDDERPAKLLFTPEEAAGLLGVRPSWLRRKAAARAIPCTFVGKHLRFSTADLTAIVTAGRQEPARRWRRSAHSP